MNTRSRLAIRVGAAALALSACGITVGTAAGTPVAYASVVTSRHAPGDARFADLRTMAQVKRAAAWAAVEPAQARPTPVDNTRFADLKDLTREQRNVAWAVVERAWG